MIHGVFSVSACRQSGVGLQGANLKHTSHIFHIQRSTDVRAWSGESVVENSVGATLAGK